MSISESILGEAEVSATTYALLAGLTFSASVLFFSIGREMTYGDFLTTTTLVATIFFVFATLQCEGAATKVREKRYRIALNRIDSANILASFGFLLMLCDLGAIGFIMGLLFGVTVTAILILLFIYCIIVTP